MARLSIKNKALIRQAVRDNLGGIRREHLGTVFYTPDAFDACIMDHLRNERGTWSAITKCVEDEIKAHGI